MKCNESFEIFTYLFNVRQQRLVYGPSALARSKWEQPWKKSNKFNWLINNFEVFPASSTSSSDIVVVVIFNQFLKKNYASSILICNDRSMHLNDLLRHKTNPKLKIQMKNWNYAHKYHAQISKRMWSIQRFFLLHLSFGKKVLSVYAHIFLLHFSSSFDYLDLCINVYGFIFIIKLDIVNGSANAQCYMIMTKMMMTDDDDIKKMMWISQLHNFVPSHFNDIMLMLCGLWTKQDVKSFLNIMSDLMGAFCFFYSFFPHVCPIVVSRCAHCYWACIAVRNICASVTLETPVECVTHQFFETTKARIVLNGIHRRRLIIQNELVYKCACVSHERAQHTIVCRFMSINHHIS